MNAPRVKLLLWSAAGLLTAGAALAVVAALVLPLDLPSPASRTAGGSVPAAPERSVASAPLDSFKPVWDLKLRRPLVDAAPPAAVVIPAQVAAARAAAAKPPVRLAGTVLDGNRRPRGMFVSANGKVEIRGAGERVAGADVLQVDEKGATLASGGQTYRLKLERFEPPATRPTTPLSPNPAGGA